MSDKITISLTPEQLETMSLLASIGAAALAGNTGALMEILALCDANDTQLTGRRVNEFFAIVKQAGDEIAKAHPEMNVAHIQLNNRKPEASDLSRYINRNLN